jgi:2-keto-4-pentenoate hydratase/2-oxohepta-3-ene-1,7-dioic acid hydratase in catechol pathway
MRLITYETCGEARVGVLLKGNPAKAVDLQQAGDLLSLGDRNFESMLRLIQSGPRYWEEASRIALEPPDEAIISLEGVSLLAPLPRPPRMRDFSVFEAHGESAGKIPKAWYDLPLYYKVNIFSVVGPNACVDWPSESDIVDYELEAAVILGTGGKGLTPDMVRANIFGYTVFNDYSARDWQAQEITCPLGPCRSKDFDGSNVLGPCIVTPDEIGNFYDLTMTARVNGELWSRGSTSTMYHRLEDMIAKISESETLIPGEIFGSGTVGAGCGFDLKRYPKRGDEIELEIEKIGILRSFVK